MARAILSKKSPRLNLTRRQIAIFREIINLGNQMSSFLNDICYKKITGEDFETAGKLAEEWGALMTRLFLEMV